MPESRRAWRDADVAKLSGMAGKMPAERVAAELGRTVGAVAVKAHELRISLRSRPTRKADADDAIAGSVS